MKQIIKKYIPKHLFSPARSVYRRGYAIVAYRHDRKRFMKHYAQNTKSDNQINTEAHVIFSAHQIEKGLSHIDFRDGFGKAALKNLRDGLEKLTDHNSTTYKAGLSAIKAYLDIHKQRHYDISVQEDIIGQDLVTEALEHGNDMSGHYTIEKASKDGNRKKNFEELFKGRYTVREFSDKQVDMAKIYEAIDISTKTPTVCNRQAFRIVIVTNHDKIKRALQIQNGFRGYDYPPVLALILTDTRSFRGVAERNNLYIDGGSFMMAFLLGLEYAGLAACPLNTMFSIKSEKETRRILDIDDNYNFISYVAIGNFRDLNKVAKSFRFSAEEITEELN